MPELFIEIKDSKYHEGIFLEEYQGVWSLVAGRTGTDGKNYKKWGFPQGKDKEPTDKAIPWKIPLGGREQATAILKALYWSLNPKEAKP